MAIDIQAGTTIGASSAALSVGLPASVLSGDLLLLFTANLSSSHTVTVAGWSKIHTSTSVDGEQINLFQKTATGSDTDPSAAVSGGGDWIIGTCVRVRGADVTTGATQITATRSRVTTASIDPTATDAVKFAAYYTFALGTCTTTWTAATKIADYWLGPGGDYMSIAYLVSDASGAIAFSSTASGDVGANIIFSVGPRSGFAGAPQVVILS